MDSNHGKENANSQHAGTSKPPQLRSSDRPTTTAICGPTTHTLAPLTKLTRHQALCMERRATNSVQTIISSTVLRYPDHNLPFDIETDASGYQLGAVIKQEFPVAFFTNSIPHKRTTTIEKDYSVSSKL
jgi:hypothetical protein